MTRMIIALFALACASCASIGPDTVPKDQFNYNAAIAQSTEEQLLVNLVRLRYSETPTFLKVTSVISQYSRTVTANAGLGANTGITGDDTANVGAGGSWTDQPTITYAPISGQEFSKNLLTPLNPRATFGLMQSGWSTDLVFRLTTLSINTTDNEITMPPRQKQAEPEFVEIVRIWTLLRDAGVVGIRNPGLEESGAEVVVSFASGPHTDPYRGDIQRLKTLLNIDPEAGEFRITFGLVPQSDGDIAVLTGSVWQIMQNVASQIEVPPEHVSEGRTVETFRSDLRDGEPPVRILYSSEPPDKPFVAVQAHDHWFYIDQRDRDSKRRFSFLQLLLSLAETNQPATGPLISISP